MALSTAQIAAMAHFDADTITELTAALTTGSATADAVSGAGACSLVREVTELTVSGTKAYTLAAPTACGQRKRIRCVSAASSPIGTLTVSSPDDTTGYVCAATFVFDTAGQEITLEATSALKWRCIGKKRAGSLAVVVGTTVLTGYSLAGAYSLSVTNTVSSDTTKALPNGSAVGERCILINTAVSGSPIGNVDGVFTGMNGTAYTHMGTIGVAASTTVTGDFAELVWTGAAWQVVNFSGITWS